MTGLLVQRVEPLSVAYDARHRARLDHPRDQPPAGELRRRLPPHRRRGAAGRRAGGLSLRARPRAARHPHRPHGVALKPRILVDRRRGGDSRLAEDDARVRRLRGDAGGHRRRGRQAGRARSARPGVPRHQDARHGRPRSAAEAAAPGRGHADRRHLRPRRHSPPRSKRRGWARSISSRSRSSSERVLVTVRNAVDTRRLQDREPAATAATPRRSYQIVGDSPSLAAVRERHSEGGADQRHGADLGRERRRQGAGGARHPSREPAARRPVRAGQLRGDPGRADRVASCSATRRARSPAPPTGRSASSSRPTRARSSSTKSAT